MGLYIVIELVSILLFLPLVITPVLGSRERFWLGYETGDRVSPNAGLRFTWDQSLIGVIFVDKNLPSPGFPFISPSSMRILPLCMEKVGIPRHLLPS